MNDLATSIARVEAHVANDRRCSPDHSARLFHELAELKLAAGDAEGACFAYAESLKCAAPNAGVLNNYASALIKTGRFQAALQTVDQALLQNPVYVRARVNRGKALRELGRLVEAVAELHEVLNMQPGYVPALINLGEALGALGDLSAAASYLEHAVRLEPKRAEVHSALGMVRLQAGDTTRALTDLQTAVSLAPQHSEMHANLAHALFVSGAWERAWPHFEFRFRRVSRPVKLAAPVGMLPWTGEISPNLVLWVIGEQGLGDQLQFARYVIALREHGIRCVLSCEPRLVSLLRQSIPGVRVVPFDNYKFDQTARYVPLMSLPAWHATRADTVPHVQGYLHAEPRHIEHWRSRLPQDGMRIALAWAGNPTMETGRYADRSPPLAAFAPLMTLPDIHWISLQKGSGAGQLDAVPFGHSILRYQDLDSGTDAFLDSAAVLMCVDLLVTSDSAIAHLAGALGVPTWLGLMHEPDWRWMRNGEQTPWYQSLRLFRQTNAGNWDGVFATIAAELRAQKGLYA